MEDVGRSCSIIVGSVSLRQHYADNRRSYPENVRYYCEKWGLPGVRAEGGYSTPFDRGGSIKDWDPPSLSRLRRLSWSRYRGPS